MKKGMISAIQKFSLHDGLGIRTIVFFKGCPLHCPWCSNPETQSDSINLMYSSSTCIQCGTCLNLCPEKCLGMDLNNFAIERARCTNCGICVNACPTKAISLRGEMKTAEELMAEIRKDVPFYRKSGGGVTFSGGEPLMQWEFVLELAKLCKRENIHLAMETTGCAPWSSMEPLIDFIDLFLYDLKIMESEIHEKILGTSNKLIIENLKKLSTYGKDIIIRVPIIPNYTDSPRNLREIIGLASSLNIKEINLLPYHNYGEKKYEQLGKTYKLSGIPSLKKENLSDLKKLFEENGFIVKLGG